MNLEELINMTDMVSLVSNYTNLQKSGNSYKGLCPFHKEDTPSFFVSQEKHIAKCFGCGKGGNPITFLMEIENIDFPSAVNKLCEINNVDHIINNKNYNILKKYNDINTMANELFQINLLQTTSGKEALGYLEKRGITNELISEFNIGLAPKNNALYNYLKELNINEDDMIKSSLIRNIDGTFSDVFSERIMFPIYDENDNLIGYSGRTLNNESSIKYLNTSENDVFKKSSILYNLNNAKKYINDTPLIVFEGYMDAISCRKTGIKSAVAQMGTALTKNQINLIKKYTNNVCLCYDNDQAGKIAFIKNAKLLRNDGIDVYAIKLPEDIKDADEYINKYGNDSFVNLIKNKVNYIDYINEIEKSNIKENKLEEYQKYKKNMFDLLKNENDTLLKKIAIEKIAHTLKINEEDVLEEYNTLKNQNQSKITKEEIVKLLYENFYNKDKNEIDLSNLDFRNYKCNINVGKMKVYGNLNLNGNFIIGNLTNSFNKVYGNILTEQNVSVNGNIYQRNNKSNKHIKSEFEK